MLVLTSGAAAGRSTTLGRVVCVARGGLHVKVNIDGEPCCVYGWVVAPMSIYG